MADTDRVSAVLLVLIFALGALLFAGLIALMVWSVAQANKRAAERRQGMAGFAHHREWEYRAEDPSLVSRFTGAPFGRGGGRRATNVLIGRHDERPMVAFDYHFTTTSSSGETTSTQEHVYSVVALNLGAHVPSLSIGPTGTLGRIFNAVTGRDIPIGDPAFDQHFTVTSTSPEFAQDVLRSDVMEVLRHHPDIAWRLDGDSMVMIRAGQHTPQEVEAKLHMMDAILDRIPTHVWDRLRGERPR